MPFSDNQNMSSRALRRLQEQKELEEATKADHENDQDVAQVVKKKTKKKKGNMFDLVRVYQYYLHIGLRLLSFTPIVADAVMQD